MNKNLAQGETILKLEGVGKSFKEVGTALTVFQNLDFELSHGEFISIQGASGIGKSTLLHIMGLLDAPSEGRVFFMGEEVTDFSDKKLSGIRNREIGFVFQFHHLLPEFTAWENVLMPTRISGTSEKGVKEKAMEMIEMVGMENRLEHLPSELSGGERQRLALARALINDPKLLLADEPSGNLDVQNTENLHQLFGELQEKLGTTLVVVTHDTGLASIAGRRYMMRATGIEEIQ